MTGQPMCEEPHVCAHFCHIGEQVSREIDALKQYEPGTGTERLVYVMAEANGHDVLYSVTIRAASIQ